jgi:type II pantothenate kinase
MADRADEHSAPAESQPDSTEHNYDLEHEEDSDSSDGAKLERRLTNSGVQDIPHPGDVRINVQGAFIVDADEEPTTPGDVGSDFEEDGYQHDPKDIRLPNHKAVVSHIAVDVRIVPSSPNQPPTIRCRN